MSKKTKEEIELLVDHQKLQEILNCGEYYKLDDEEKKCVLDHRMGTKHHLLKEGYYVHRNGLVITKLLSEELDVEQFLKDALSCAGFNSIVYIGNDFDALH